MKLKDTDLKDKDGKWLMSAADEVYCTPMLELSCGKVRMVVYYFYLYNYQLGTNDGDFDYGLLQRQISNYFRHEK